MRGRVQQDAFQGRWRGTMPAFAGLADLRQVMAFDDSSSGDQPEGSRLERRSASARPFSLPNTTERK